MIKVDFSKYYKPKQKQALAHSNRAKYLLFGGAMGGGKSWFLCAEAIKNAMMFQGNRLVIVRKELSVAKRTILTTFFSICPSQIIKNYNQSNSTIEFINGSILIFIEANISKDPLLNKIKGLEIGWFGIDEANEVSIEVYKVLKTRMRWVLPNGKKPRYEGRLTSNPEQSWLIPTFIQSINIDEVYIQSLTSDNYDEDSEYIKNLKEAFKNSPNMMRKYLLGDWSMVDTINQLIPSMSLAKAEKLVQDDCSISMGIDPSRYGNDRTVFIILKNGNIELIETHQETSTNQIATRAIALMNEYNINAGNVGIDGVGIGAGIIDHLYSMNYEVLELIGGAKPIETDEEDAFLPFNLRSQMYYELRRDIINEKLGNITDTTLKLELSAIQYEISSEKSVKVLGKDTIKKVLGTSPDLADALCYANWTKVWRGERKMFLPICGGL